MLSNEQINKLIKDQWDSGDSLCDRAHITAFIRAIEAAVLPEGLVAVPKSPDWFFMFLKEWDHFKGMGNRWAAKFYEQLIAAAPTGSESAEKGSSDGR